MADRIEDLSWVYETPNVEVKGYEEMPSPPGGAARWGEAVETPARTGELKASSPEYYPEGVWNQAKEIGRRLGATIGWAKDKAKQNLAYGAEALAGNDTDTLNEIVPANTQGWWDYYTKKQDYDSDKDMPYSAYVSPAVKPSDEYAGFTDTVLYNDTLDPDKAQPGKVGRAIGDFINRLGGNFESTDKEDELAYKKGLAAAQGVQGYLGDTLPEQIEALVGELGLRGTMATLSPAIARQLREKGDPNWEMSDGARKYTPYSEIERRGLPNKGALNSWEVAIDDKGYPNPQVQKAIDKAIDKRYIRGKNGRELKRLYETRNDVFHKWSDAYGDDVARETYSQMLDGLNDAIRELEKTNTPKPLPNPEVQRAIALNRNNRLMYNDLYSNQIDAGKVFPTDAQIAEAVKYGGLNGEEAARQAVKMADSYLEW